MWHWADPQIHSEFNWNAGPSHTERDFLWLLSVSQYHFIFVFWTLSFYCCWHEYYMTNWGFTITLASSSSKLMGQCVCLRNISCSYSHFWIQGARPLILWQYSRSLHQITRYTRFGEHNHHILYHVSSLYHQLYTKKRENNSILENVNETKIWSIPIVCSVCVWMRVSFFFVLFK